jgi:hypothetical protein
MGMAIASYADFPSAAALTMSPWRCIRETSQNSSEMGQVASIETEIEISFSSQALISGFSLPFSFHSRGGAAARRPRKQRTTNFWASEEREKRKLGHVRRALVCDKRNLMEPNGEAFSFLSFSSSSSVRKRD